MLNPSCSAPRKTRGPFPRSDASPFPLPFLPFLSFLFNPPAPIPLCAVARRFFALHPWPLQLGSSVLTLARMQALRESEGLRGGRYAVVGALGEGSQGTTLEAVDKRDGRLVAIKRFSVRGAKEWKDVELAEREARVLSTLSHETLPAFVETFEEDGALYLVMERIEGDSLRSLQKRGHRFTQDDVVSFLAAIAPVLDYLHGHAPPIIHRDIKPANVIRRPDGSYALVDFGSVRDRLKPAGGSTVVGTFGYMAPEQFQGRAQPSSDVYAVGATALSMLAAAEPETLPHRGLAIDVPAVLSGQVDPGLTRVLTAMLEPDPDKRPRAITPLLAKLSLDASEDDRHRPRSRRRRRRSGLQRRQSRSRSFFSHPVIVTLALSVLSLVSLVTWALLQFALPLVLTLLSVVLGRRLRSAAKAVSSAGRRGRRGLRRAGRYVREQSDSAAAARHEARQVQQASPPEDTISEARPTLRARVANQRPRVMDPSETEGEDWGEETDADEVETAREHRHFV